MLQKCLPSVSTLAAMLNSYASVPPCHWLDSLSPELYQVSVIRLLGSTLRSSTPHLVLSLSLRSTVSSGTRCVSGAACPARCSISVATPCACTWGRTATRCWALWAFPALSGNICCCARTAPSTDGSILCYRVQSTVGACVAPWPQDPLVLALKC